MVNINGKTITNRTLRDVDQLAAIADLKDRAARLTSMIARLNAQVSAGQDTTSTAKDYYGIFNHHVHETLDMLRSDQEEAAAKKLMRASKS